MADDRGITTRPTKGGSPRFRAQVWDNQQQRNVYETFPTRAAARNWRRDMQVKLARGEALAAKPITVKQAYEVWIDAARGGTVRSRGGATYKPSALHGYANAFESRLLFQFGHMKVGDLRRVGIQRYVDQLVAEGLAAQTIRNILVALRVLLKWCVREEMIATNPCDDLELPSGGEVRDRIATPTEARALLDAIPNELDRAIMATAFYSGLRRGELMALRWSSVDLVGKRIEVREAYDPRTQTLGLPKSAAGFRVGSNAPGIPDALVPYLAALCGDEPAEGLVFEGFNPAALARRCKAAWAEAGLEPISLHECRHTYASICIAAGINIKTLSTWMGHSSITITLDRYGHLLPGSTQEALGLLNAHLEHDEHRALNFELSQRLRAQREEG